MAFYKEEGREDARECPVCYECLSGAERTLSCGHVFCHDCLVKTLVNGDGSITKTIICPICRHITFIKKQKEALVSLAADKDLESGAQTLEVPLSPALGQPRGARRAARVSPAGRLGRVAHWFRGISERRKLISPSHNASQIFIITAQGRPMVEADAPGAVMTVRRRRRRICTTARCLLALLSAFTILALVAATLPWILLA